MYFKGINMNYVAFTSKQRVATTVKAGVSSGGSHVAAYNTKNLIACLEKFFQKDH